MYKIMGEGGFSHKFDLKLSFFYREKINVPNDTTS